MKSCEIKRVDGTISSHLDLTFKALKIKIIDTQKIIGLYE